MSGASPHTGDDVPAGCLKCKVRLAYGATFCETIPAVGRKAVHRETDDHNDNVHKHQPIGEVGASEIGEEKEGGRKGGREKGRKAERKGEEEGGRGGRERREKGGKGERGGEGGREKEREGRKEGKRERREGKRR